LNTFFIAWRICIGSADLLTNPFAPLFKALLTIAINKKYYTYGLSGGKNIYNGLAEQFLTPGPERNFYVGVIYNFGEKKKSDAKKHDKD